MHERHLYLLGIGGVGMVWIADYALAQGWKVSGSDLSETAQTQRLQAKGAKIHIGVDPSTIPAGVTEAVLTSAISESAPSYPMLAELVRRKVSYCKRAEWIGTLTKQYLTIAVCGTHGKTTTTAMIGWILQEAGYDPTVFVGASLKAWGGETKIGASKYLVIEADEYDRSFHHFHPQVAVVLNIDPDHLDYYKGGISEIIQSYHRFLRNLPSGVHAQPNGKGVVIAYKRDKHIRQAVKGFNYAFHWYDEADVWPGLQPPQPGDIYRLNALAAAKVAHELGVPTPVIMNAIKNFPGADRRLEYLGRWNQAEVYDDYAHHPVEVRKTLAALRERFPKQDTQLTLVFQPHQAARTKVFLKDYGRAFDQDSPDHLIIAPIYQVAGREDGIEVSAADVVTEIRRKLPRDLQVEAATDEQALETLVREASQRPGVLISMGAGSIRSLIDTWRTDV